MTIYDRIRLIDGRSVVFQFVFSREVEISRKSEFFFQRRGTVSVLPDTKKGTPKDPFFHCLEW